MNIKILFSDNLHFHERGFKSLFDFIKKFNIKHSFALKNIDEKKYLNKYGNYKDVKSNFLENYLLLEKLSLDELFSYSCKSINLFKISKAEILSHVMTLPHWYNEKIPSDDKFIFKKLFDENKESLILNISVAQYWVEFWSNYIKNNERYTHCCIFSGSLIYKKALMEISKNTAMEVMVFEHFFSGNDYYCEHKYEHIANNSDIKFPNIYNKKYSLDELDDYTYNKEKIKAINKVLNAKNKNVQQPNRIDENIFNNDKKTVLILGQVVNDFSIIETKLKNINSISFYKELIEKIIINTDFNIIFKAHPWERKKVNIDSSVTYNELMKFSIEQGFKDRLKLVEDFNINSLFDQSDLINVLCSQSAIEAAFEGKKVIQFGNAFYSNKGFTYDYTSVDEYIKDIDNLNGNLTLDEYINFENFLIKTFQYHLISVNNEGINKLKSIFFKNHTVKLVHKKQEKVIILKEDYEISKLKIKLQKIKKIPILGKSLLWFKHKVLKWDM